MSPKTEPMKKGFYIFCLSALLSSSAISQNLEFDKKKGAETAIQIASYVEVDTSSKTAKYLQEVGNRLVNNLDDKLFDFKFHLIDMSEPNAFALPGGYVYLTRGILVLLNNEDELAGIMGHEIIHVQNRHSYKAAKKSILPAVLKAPGNVVGLVNEDLGNLINAPVNVTSALQLAKYGRKQENEADADGMTLAAHSGYNPAALAGALESLRKDIEYLTGMKEKFSYFDDHPITKDRIESVIESSKTINIREQPSIALDKAEFLSKMSDIYIGEHPKQGVFNKNRFFQADLNLDISFPAGWKLANKSTYLAAQQPEGKAVVFVIVVPGNLEPSEYGEMFIKKFRNRYRVESYRSEKLDINGNPAFVFGVDEMSTGQVNNSTVIWVKQDGITFQIVGSGLKKFEKDFENTANSITGLTNETRMKITGIVLSYMESKEGESLKDLSSRTGNVLNLDYLSLINGIQPDIILKEGQLLKIGIQKQFMPEE